MLLIVAAAALAAVGVWFVVTIGWVADAKVTSSIGGWTVNGEKSVTFTYTVTLGKNVNPADVRCEVTAQAKDFSSVGGPVTIVPPSGGTHSYTMRTSRHAVYVSWAGCSAPGQSNPR
ncbi:hypothetical protein Back2_22940 [Nocardioides baekrokdamisoli]|uniref:DUF4307 domain-containing protein n=2 Tax=Nocardioides baekrokdamisoli TaxID=1804624 RepID=A0A3G9IG95_9ACTN|nr:hypothetical protein Back2_22940 [Nocardioides baekrokdamisoli]